MKMTIIPLCFLAVLAGCQSITPDYKRDPTFGQGVTGMFDAMIVKENMEAQVLGSIYFTFDEAELREASKLQLDRMAQQLKRVSGPVLVLGHTDHVNTDRYNLRLGYQRALAVAQYLRSAGVWEERLVIRGFGETRPTDSNWRESGRKLNRRVDVKILAQGDSISGPEAQKAYKKTLTDCDKENENEGFRLLLQNSGQKKE